jgi:hypothetical protein
LLEKTFAMVTALRHTRFPGSLGTHPKKSKDFFRLLRLNPVCPNDRCCWWFENCNQAGLGYAYPMVES